MQENYKGVDSQAKSSVKQEDNMCTDEKEQFGRYLEEFHVGDIYKHWPGKTIMESDNNLW